MENLKFRHELVVDMPYVLLKFLIKEKALGKFVSNNTFEDKWVIKGYTDAIKKGQVPADRLILAAFVWNETEEGHDFWEDLHQRFEKYLKYHEKRTNS